MRAVVFLVLFLPMCVFAAWSTTSGVVNNIYSHNGTVLIDTGITDGPCGNGKGFWWPTTDDDSQIMLSLVLSAQSSGKKITVVYGAECLYDRAKITHMKLLGS